MRMFIMKRMRVGNQYPIYVVDMSKRRYTCLVRYEEYKQELGAYDFSELLHVPIPIFLI